MDFFATFRVFNAYIMIFKKLSFFSLFIGFCISITAQNLPVKAFSIFAPTPDKVTTFIKFIDEELAPNGINTLVMQIDYNYEYTSKPELREKNPLSKEQVKQILAACKKNNIELIPLVNLFGHQSYGSTMRKLLREYPQFDENPNFSLPHTYKWPNPTDFYCKSYCPKHPDLHAVIFDLIDEIVEVFEAKNFHAGMDEVFIIAHHKCPRCKGEDPSKLFADEVTKIANHLDKKDVRLWIWGDRLLEGKTSGMGMWEASYNNTHRAIDNIPKSVVICDWHYNKALPTPLYFAVKGFDVIACSWNVAEVAKDQVKMLSFFRKNATPEMTDRYLGVMQTVWSPAAVFIDEYYSNETAKKENKKSPVKSFKAMVKQLNK